MRLKKIASLSLALIVLSSSNFVYADSLEQRVDQLEKRLDALEHGVNKNPNKSKIKSINAGSGGWKNKENWRALKKGLSESEVRSLLGDAGKISVNTYTVTWYYNYPYGSSVDFDAKTMLVDGWSE